MSWYIGFKHNSLIATIFEFEDIITKNKFGKKYTNVGGPFKTKVDAVNKTYQSGYSPRIEEQIKKRNPILGKLSGKESSLFPLAYQHGAQKIKAGRIWVDATFKTITAANVFATFVARRNFDYKTRMNKDKQWIVSFRDPIGIKKKNPPTATDIYDNILAIEAVKGKRSLWPNEKFRHDFKQGGKIIGLSDGSLLIKPKKKDGKLWKNFDY